MRVSPIARRSNQSILKEINLKYSLEGLMLRKIKGKNRSGQQRKRCLDSITDSMDMNLNRPWEIVKDKSIRCYSPRGHKESDTT